MQAAGYHSSESGWTHALDVNCIFVFSTVEGLSRTPHASSSLRTYLSPLLVLVADKR
jgi:hypothetical protein